MRPAVDFDPASLPGSGEVAVEEVEKVFNRRITPVYGVRYVHKAFGPFKAISSGVVAAPPSARAPVCGSPSGPLGTLAAPQALPVRPMSVPNKMIPPSVPPGRSFGSFGIRRK